MLYRNSVRKIKTVNGIRCRKKWADKMRKGVSVEVEILLKYERNSGAPSSFSVESKIDGVTQLPQELFN